MDIKFRVEYIFENVDRHGPHLLAKLLTNESNFHLTEKSTLGGFEIKRFGIPRALDDDGNLKIDLFTFDLKNKADLLNFKKGDIVIYNPS